MNTALKELEQLSLGAMAQVLLDTQALPLRTWRDHGQINHALGTAPRHAWIVRRWLAALSRANILQDDGDRLGWHDTPPQVAIGELPRLYAALGFPASMANLHTHVIAGLPGLLRDETALASLLFQAGEPVAVLGAYQQNHFTAAINHALGARARQVSAVGEVLRVLELGGGAGCTTTAVLTALDGRAVDYRFTDVSPLFTVAAQRRFRLEPGMSFALLDLDRDFSDHGIQPHGFDLVIAGNVLHNARDLPNSLGHIRACLRDGGTLLFSESIADNPAMLTFMHLLLSPSKDAPPRVTDEVFIGPPQWRQALQASGFELLEIWPADDQPVAAAGQRLFHAVGVSQ
ncbi:class I SAM-dependent methyltransferase [Pseudomonas fluorescens]|uniref:Class I SAM-dependent methyltransferase n=1 Tax=Pseudomonas fluorescens TaxID=294 RepID=A0A944DKD4_PSEFL|nr:class I SAM-dependent methyltransferase [Pseudomonas fluorescens]MBT2297498.1 class I SAM-dependent methyltransferase [Pseudomonas fluorescens]MBT2305696.1 class I SAM-dependent methyltransferase [Pseudomonas fluorescens]MBT2314281.1 class I SAM-dependent methyltransferase [Pseudomonas fluorescens]MBT2319227.1 class I SAM-dependent methyltransferase [Pseudomonas fluorescens]MBT2328500.1 class I SAM-dependent methyltransferase [Pseudomonas fluorescens]